jgi:hypothetical protein
MKLPILPFVLNSIPSWVDEVIVVDGRSRDDMERVARVLHPEVRIIRESRRGIGAALRAGLDTAHSDILVVIDADGSMDGGAIAALRDALRSGADYVKDTRFCDGAGSADITGIRRVGDIGFCPRHSRSASASAPTITASAPATIPAASSSWGTSWSSHTTSTVSSAGKLGIASAPGPSRPPWHQWAKTFTQATSIVLGVDGGLGANGFTWMERCMASWGMWAVWVSVNNSVPSIHTLMSLGSHSSA